MQSEQIDQILMMTQVFFTGFAMLKNLTHFFFYSHSFMSAYGKKSCGPLRVVIKQFGYVKLVSQPDALSGGSFHTVRHVAPPCLYSSPEQTNQTLTLGTAYHIFHFPF